MIWLPYDNGGCSHCTTSKDYGSIKLVSCGGINYLVFQKRGGLWEWWSLANRKDNLGAIIPGHPKFDKQLFAIITPEAWEVLVRLV
jgi:hypothetical protein